jgi:hypothetical protein
VLVRFDHIARFIENANHRRHVNDGNCRAYQAWDPAKGGKVGLAAYSAVQLMLELLIAKFLEPRTPDFIELLHGN